MSYPNFILPKEINTIEIAIINKTGNAYFQPKDIEWLASTFYFDSTLKVVPSNGQLRLTFTINPDKFAKGGFADVYYYNMVNSYVISTKNGDVLTDGVCANNVNTPYFISTSPSFNIGTYKNNVKDQLVQLCRMVRLSYDFAMNKQNIEFSRIKGDGYEKFDSLNNRLEDYFKTKKIKPPYAAIEDLLNKSFNYYKILAEQKVGDEDKQKNVLFAIHSNEIILYSLIEKFNDAEKSLAKLEALDMKGNRTDYYKKFYTDRKNNLELYQKSLALFNKNDLSYLYKDGKVPGKEEKKPIVSTANTTSKPKKKNVLNFAMAGSHINSIPADKSDEEFINDFITNYEITPEVKRVSIDNLLIYRRYKLGLLLIDSGFVHGDDIGSMFGRPFSDGPKNNAPVYTKQYTNDERIYYIKEYMKRGYKVNQRAVILLDEEGEKSKKVQDFLMEHLNADEKNDIYNHYVYKAMEANNTDLFKSYIDKGVKLNPEYANISGTTNIEIMKMYQAQGISLDQHNVYGQTTLRLAIESGKADNIKYLLEQGADPCRKDNSGKNALSIAKKIDSFKTPEIKNEIVELLKVKTENCK